MSRHRKKPTKLNEGDLAAILAAAEQLHRAAVRPRITTQCDDYQALARLISTLLKTVEEITGESGLPWVSHGLFGANPGLPRKPATE